MRRKLIPFDAFKQIQERSLTSAEKELVEAEGVLAKALNQDQLVLESFNNTEVTYKTLNDTYIHANYKLGNGNVVFENIEEMVVDEETERKHARGLLANMVDELINNNEEKAASAFSEYMSLDSTRRNLMEGDVKFFVKKKKDCKDKKSKGKKKKFGGNVMIAAKFKKGQKQLKEWGVLAENVLNYVDAQEYGPALKNSQVQKDSQGEITAVKLPVSSLRNEGKVLSFNWKTLNTEVQVLRSKTKNIHEDVNFCRAMADLRHYAAMSSNTELQETLQKVVGRWSNLMYLTQPELQKEVKLALETTNQSNYDDGMCQYLSDAIIKTAVETYSDKVNKIFRLAGVRETPRDVFEAFKNVTEKFYPALDETMQLEMQVFVDLYNALATIHNEAAKAKDEILKSEANDYLKDLYAVVNGEAEPTLELAADASAWLYDIVETNLETSDWDVSNTPFITTNGDNPATKDWAKKTYSPAQDASGDWGDVAPVSDGKNYKGGLADEMRNNGFGNWSDNDVWPSLDNKYVPNAPDIYKIKDVSQDDGLGFNGGANTWPSLTNPIVPSAMTPKMKNDNLVVDR